MIRFRKKASVLLGDLLLATVVVGVAMWLVGVADPWGGLAILAFLPGAFYLTGVSPAPGVPAVRRGGPLDVSG